MKQCPILLILFCLSPVWVMSQTGSKPYQPAEGQMGKDVIWLPTPYSLVKGMLEMAEVTPNDYLIDLGSGDGRIVIEAAKLGAYAVGVEYERGLVELSVKKAKEEGVAENAVFFNADIFEFDLSKATVISMFLLPDLNLRLRPGLLALKPGTRIISNTFDMGDWEPDQEIVVDYQDEEYSDSNMRGLQSTARAFLWVVPARVGGKWETKDGECHFEQSYQQITGTFNTDTKSAEIQEGRLVGNEINFKVGGEKFTGTVSGNRISGTVTTQKGSEELTFIRK